MVKEKEVDPVYVDQMVDNTLCDVNEIKKVMEYRDGWRKIVNKCRASSTYVDMVR